MGGGKGKRGIKERNKWVKDKRYERYSLLSFNEPLPVVPQYYVCVHFSSFFLPGVLDMTSLLPLSYLICNTLKGNYLFALLRCSS
jgi:hypothetical protein